MNTPSVVDDRIQVVSCKKHNKCSCISLTPDIQTCSHLQELKKSNAFNNLSTIHQYLRMIHLPLSHKVDIFYFLFCLTFLMLILFSHTFSMCLFYFFLFIFFYCVSSYLFLNVLIVLMF